ncbi:MAG: uncharacterized protein KVP18_000769 [Porospora cf. gigantea A]|nr:MAG: hypothetical protein KVP18_000769 [Porospora cf. gigantea A]
MGGAHKGTRKVLMPLQWCTGSVQRSIRDVLGPLEALLSEYSQPLLHVAQAMDKVSKKLAESAIHVLDGVPQYVAVVSGSERRGVPASRAWMARTVGLLTRAHLQHPRRNVVGSLDFIRALFLLSEHTFIISSTGYMLLCGEAVTLAIPLVDLLDVRKEMDHVIISWSEGDASVSRLALTAPTELLWSVRREWAVCGQHEI